MVVDAPLGEFGTLSVGGNLVPAAYVFVSAGAGGGTQVTISEVYLKTLANGAFDVVALFEDGVAYTTLTVAVQGNTNGGGDGSGSGSGSGSGARTGDELLRASVLGFALLLLSSTLAIWLLVLRMRRRRG